MTQDIKNLLNDIEEQEEVKEDEQIEKWEEE
jgi:hypothetical protein